VALLFTETTLRTNVFLKVLHDPVAAELLPKCVYVRVAFKKDSGEAKRLKVAAAPVLLLLDPTGEAPKELRRLAGGSARELRAAMEAAIQKLAR
jgi:hypothetical protein